MSRAADLANRKGGQKAALAEKNASHAADLAMGLTSTMQKAIKGDTLLCTVCGATALGPMTACQCTGGRSKPDGGYDTKRQLLDAAQARSKESQKAKMNAGAANQGAVAAAKAKAKLDKGNDAADLDLSTQDLCEITFAPGKLGMSIEKNCACAVAEGGNAAQLKVQAGWVIRKVNGEDVAPTKEAIMKAAGAAMKKGELKITFQFPLEEGQQHCSACDKFVEAAEFEGASVGLDAGPGKQVCASCEEYGDMF